MAWTAGTSRLPTWTKMATEDAARVQGQMVHMMGKATVIHTAEGAMSAPAVRSTRRYWNTTL